MKLLIDLNIFIDIFQKREPHYTDSSQVLSWVLNEAISCVLAGHTVTTLYYLLSRNPGKEKALEVIDWLLSNFEIESADRTGFREARRLDMSDFEDAVVVSCAINANCDYIVTRNIKDFKRSPVPALTPGEFLKKP